jgi:hypothetical protein
MLDKNKLESLLVHGCICCFAVFTHAEAAPVMVDSHSSRHGAWALALAMFFGAPSVSVLASLCRRTAGFGGQARLSWCCMSVDVRDGPAVLICESHARHW